MEAEALEFFAGAGELAFAAVDDDEVGETDEGVERLGGGRGFETAEGFERRFLGSVGLIWAEGVAAFEEDALVAAADDFGHGGEVVLGADGADAVAAVGGGVCGSVGEADHTGDDVVGGDVGDVEAFHGEGDAVEAEDFGEFPDIFHGVDVGAGDAALSGETACGLEGFAEIGEHVAEVGGAFEVEFCGGGHHFCFDFLEVVAGAAVEERAGVVDACEVFGAGDAADAGGGAIADEVIVAVAVVVFAWGDGSAGTEAELFLHPCEGGAETAAVGEGTEVASAVVFAGSGEVEAWPWFLGVDLEEEEAFVVAEGDVIAGPVFLDETAFEEEGFWFVADRVEFEVPDAVDEGAGFEVGEAGAGWLEVVAETAAEVAGFTDVDDAVEAVAHEVDAWLVGDVVESGDEIRFFAHGSAGGGDGELFRGGGVGEDEGGGEDGGDADGDAAGVELVAGMEGERIRVVADADEGGPFGGLDETAADGEEMVRVVVAAEPDFGEVGEVGGARAEGDETMGDGVDDPARGADGVAGGEGEGLRGIGELEGS